MELEDVFNYWNFSPLNQGRNLGIRWVVGGGFFNLPTLVEETWKIFAEGAGWTDVLYHWRSVSKLFGCIFFTEVLAPADVSDEGLKVQVG